MRRRGTIAAIGLAVLVVAVLVWLVRPVGDGVPLDPRGTGPTGTAGMLRTVERLGAEVSVGSRAPEDATDQTIVVLADRLDPATRDAVDARVRAGARLVLFDPASPLNPVPVVTAVITDAFGVVGREPSCPLLDGVVQRVESARWAVLDPGPAAGARCFPVGDGVGLVTRPLGEGEVVVTGAVDALVNRSIADADHARLAAALLVPEGDGLVTVVWDAALGGDTELLDLLPDGVRRGLWLLALAALLYALGRSRRLGPPVAERLPVRVPASELALAIGDLHARHGHREAAAARLREDLRGEVARVLQVPTDTSAVVLVELLQDRLADQSTASAVDVADLRIALLDGAVPDDASLMAVASALVRVRARLTRPPRPHGAAGTPQ